MELEAWNRSLLEHFTIVAVEGDATAGFGDIDISGYMDRLHVHAGYRRRGVATAISDAPEQAADAPAIMTHASITARPFFERRGVCGGTRAAGVWNGVALANFVMEKRRHQKRPPHAAVSGCKEPGEPELASALSKLKRTRLESRMRDGF